MQLTVQCIEDTNNSSSAYKQRRRSKINFQQRQTCRLFANKRQRPKWTEKPGSRCDDANMAAMARHSRSNSRSTGQSPLTIVRADPVCALLGPAYPINPPLFSSLRQVSRSKVSSQIKSLDTFGPTLCVPSWNKGRSSTWKTRLTGEPVRKLIITVAKQYLSIRPHVYQTSVPANQILTMGIL